MLKRYRNKRKSGQAIVEMAFLFPFFLLVIVGGIIDFGFAFYNLLSLQQIANDTAQWAAESNGIIGRRNASEITQYAQSKKPAWWSGVFTVHTPEVVTTATNAEVIRVAMSYESPTYTPFYQTILGAVTGSTYIKLGVFAGYQIPKVVAVR